MNGRRVTIHGLTHAQARALIAAADQAAGSAVDLQAARLFRRAGAAIQAALTVQEERRLELARRRAEGASAREVRRFAGRVVPTDTVIPGGDYL